MAQVTFGTVLRKARERKGLDLASAARRLRIRPDILRAIEEDDFSRMPPRGYTRNMVNAYARLLGLNPTEITRMYLDEAYAYQVGRARSDTRPSGFDMGGTSRTKRPREKAPQQDQVSERQAPRQNAFGRALYDDRTAFSRPDYGHQRTSDGSDARVAPGRVYNEGRTHTSRHTALPTTQYTNFYAGPKAPSGIQSKLPFIVAGGVILVVLIVVLFFVFGNKSSGTEDLPKIAVTGLDDTTQGEEGTDQQQAPPTPVEVAPTSAKVVYELASGQTAWIILTADGESKQDSITGPIKETVDVTGKWSLASWVSDAFTVTVNGTKVAFDATNEQGMPMVSVDFNTILEKWKADHPAAGGTTAPAGDAANTTGTTGTSTNAGTAA